MLLILLFFLFGTGVLCQQSTQSSGNSNAASLQSNQSWFFPGGLMLSPPPMPGMRPPMPFHQVNATFGAQGNPTFSGGKPLAPPFVFPATAIQNGQDSFGMQGNWSNVAGSRPFSPGMTGPPSFTMPLMPSANGQVDGSFGLQGNWPSTAGGRPLQPGMISPSFMRPPMRPPFGQVNSAGNRPGMGAFPLGMRPAPQGTNGFPPAMTGFPLDTSPQGSTTLPQSMAVAPQPPATVNQPTTTPPSANSSSDQLQLPPLFRPVASEQ